MRFLVCLRNNWFRGALLSLALTTPVEVSAEPLDRSAAGDAECLAVEEAFAANNLEVLQALQPRQPQWQALQAFRRAAIHIPAADKPAARAAVRDGLAAVNQGLASVPPDDPVLRGELLLLGAMLDGQFLLIDRWRLLRNGWRGLRRLRRAERLVPDSPRAALVRGTAKVVAPWALGGDAMEAIELLQSGVRDTPLCLAGDWAQVDVLNWLGRAHAKLDQVERARALYERALVRSPGNHWVLLALRDEGYEWTEHGEDDSPPE